MRRERFSMLTEKVKEYLDTLGNQIPNSRVFRQEVA
jgi:hypothetical protein